MTGVGQELPPGNSDESGAILESVEPQPDDPDGLDLTALHRHLADRDIPQAGELRAELISGGRSNLTFPVFDDASKWVFRRHCYTG